MVEKIEKTKVKSPLLNKKITIALVKRSQSLLHKDPDTGTLAAGGKKSFMCPPDKFGNLINPLTPEEQEYFETLLRIDLNPYLERTKNFYCSKNSMITLTKIGKKTSSADLILDLSKPYDYIKYKIARINPRVAQTWAERDNKAYEFVILDGDVELADDLSYNEKEDAVNAYLLANKTSKKKLFDLLRMYGIQYASKEVTYANSTEWIYNELKKCARKPKDVEKLYTLVSLGEKDIHSKIFIADCISMGLIDKRGPYEYRLSGGDKFASNEEDAITWFEDKRNTSTRVKFEQIIEDYYEKHK